MESREIQYQNIEDEQFIELLFRAGARRSECRILVFLVHNNGATARQIETGTDMSASVCSKITGLLGERGWVTYSKSPDKQRLRCYYLTPVFGEFISEIERMARERVALCKEGKRRVRGGFDS